MSLVRGQVGSMFAVEAPQSLGHYHRCARAIQDLVTCHHLLHLVLTTTARHRRKSDLRDVALRSRRKRGGNVASVIIAKAKENLHRRAGENRRAKIRRHLLEILARQ